MLTDPHALLWPVPDRVEAGGLRLYHLGRYCRALGLRPSHETRRVRAFFARRGLQVIHRRVALQGPSGAAVIRRPPMRPPAEPHVCVRAPAHHHRHHTDAHARA